MKKYLAFYLTEIAVMVGITLLVWESSYRILVIIVSFFFLFIGKEKVSSQIRKEILEQAKQIDPVAYEFILRMPPPELRTQAYSKMQTYLEDRFGDKISSLLTIWTVYASLNLCMLFIPIILAVIAFSLQ